MAGSFSPTATLPSVIVRFTCNTAVGSHDTFLSLLRSSHAARHILRSQIFSQCERAAALISPTAPFSYFSPPTFDRVISLSPFYFSGIETGQRESRFLRVVASESCARHSLVSGSPRNFLCRLYSPILDNACRAQRSEC